MDERLVTPETRTEMIHGELYFTPPADEPHATVHIDLATVLRTHLAPGYKGALDMLTRTSEKNDFASAACVFPEERDPKTGGRRLEELAFEVASEQSIGVPTTKARELVRRGVRRVFCMLVKKGQMLEWSRQADRFQPLAQGADIEDRCFVRPLPVRALLNAADFDRALVEALVARESPAIMAIREEALARGLAKGLAKGHKLGLLEGRKDALRLVLRARAIHVDEAAKERIKACDDEALLERWAKRALESQTIDEVFEE